MSVFRFSKKIDTRDQQSEDKINPGNTVYVQLQWASNEIRFSDVEKVFKQRKQNNCIFQVKLGETSRSSTSNEEK